MWIETTDGRLVNLRHVQIIGRAEGGGCLLWGPNSQHKIGTVAVTIQDMRQRLVGLTPEERAAKPLTATRNP